MSPVVLLDIGEQAGSVKVAPYTHLLDAVLFQYSTDLAGHKISVGGGVYLLLSELGELAALLGELAVDIGPYGAVVGFKDIVIPVADDKPDAQQLALSLIYIEAAGKFKICKAKIFLRNTSLPFRYDLCSYPLRQLTKNSYSSAFSSSDSS